MDFKKTNRNNLSKLAAFAIVIVFVLSLVNLGMTTGKQTSNSPSYGISYHSSVCKFVTRVDGSIDSLGCTHNTFKNSGRNITRDLLGTYSGLSAVNVIGLGNGTGDDGTPAQSNIGGLIVDCSLGPGAGSFATTQNSAGNWTITKQFTNGCSNEIVNSTALYNSTTAGTANYFAANNFQSTTLQSGDMITIVWYIWIQ